jgi:Cofactor assembly of complex C subunit B, CCB2/CCB4
LLFDNANAVADDSTLLSWTLASIAAATPASTAILMVHSSGRWQPMAYTGVVHPNLPILDDTVTMNPATPILDRFLRNELRNELQTEGGLQRSESYLPTLQALPGKTEFTNSLLPPNAQAALLLPVALVPAANEEPYRQAVLLLGSNQARSFTPRDIAWCQTVIARLETTSNDGDLNR